MGASDPGRGATSGASSEATFPEGFLWGTSTAAHQVEGHTTGNQWWAWEQDADVPASGAACEHYERYEDDVERMAELGYDAYRFSIEWSRVEPAPGEFDEAAIAHYRDVLGTVRDAGLTPIPMLWHYTNPTWFMRRGGWSDADNVDAFERYVEEIASRFDVEYWLTVDEPMVYAHRTVVDDDAPPAAMTADGWVDQERSLEALLTVGSNLLRAHARAYDVIHDHRDAKVSLAKAVNPVYPGSEAGLDVWAADVRSWLEHDVWLASLAAGELLPPLPSGQLGECLDFFGLNYFFPRQGYFEPDAPEPPYWQFQTRTPADAPTNEIGWWIRPEAIADAIRRVEEFLDVPIVVTSTGTAAATDRERRQFVVDHVRQVGRAIEEGADVRGLLYWSFVDNYEWDLGFEPRFGLVQVDFETQERRPRESARCFGEIAAANGVTAEIEAAYG